MNIFPLTKILITSLTCFSLTGLVGPFSDQDLYSPHFVTKEKALNLELPTLSTIDHSQKKVSLSKEEKFTQKDDTEKATHEKMRLKTAFDPSRKSILLKEDQISGMAEVKGGELFLENIVLHKGSHRVTEAFSIDGVRPSEYGYFDYDHAHYGRIQGIVTFDKNLSVRFSTGPLANIHLIFMNPS